MKRILTFAILALTFGCSNYVRKADPGVSAQDVFNKLQQLESQSGSASITSTLTSDSTVYYSEGPGPLGPPVSVAALVDFSDFGVGGITTDDISSVQVFLVVTPSSGNATLLVGIQTSGASSYQVSSFSGSFSSDKGGFTATLSGTSTLTLESNDVDSDGNLQGVMQADVTGSAGYIGKFSTLVGFQQ